MKTDAAGDEVGAAPNENKLFDDPVCGVVAIGVNPIDVLVTDVVFCVVTGVYVNPISLLCDWVPALVALVLPLDGLPKLKPVEPKLNEEAAGVLEDT